MNLRFLRRERKPQIDGVQNDRLKGLLKMNEVKGAAKTIKASIDY